MTGHFGITESVTVWIALWGAVLSTFLGVLRAWEFWADRFRIQIGVTLTSDIDLGNTVTIRNLGGKPVIVEYWELVWRSGWWPRHKESLLNSPGECARDIQIAPGASEPLQFSGPDYFDWNASALQGRSICISLHIAGRKRRVLQKLAG